MSNNRRVTLKGNQNIIVEFTNERIIPAGGLSVVGALLGKSDFVKKLNRMDVTKNRSQHQIKMVTFSLPTLVCYSWESLILRLYMRWMTIMSFTKRH